MTEASTTRAQVLQGKLDAAMATLTKVLAGDSSAGTSGEAAGPSSTGADEQGPNRPELIDLVQERADCEAELLSGSDDFYDPTAATEDPSDMSTGEEVEDNSANSCPFM